MKLKWALAELRKNPTESFPVSDRVDLEEALKGRSKEVIAASPAEIEGYIMLEGFNQFLVTLTIKIDLTLPSTRSLEPTTVSLSVPFTELYLAPASDQKTSEVHDLVFNLEKDYIDLQKPIEDAVLTSIPLKVLTEAERQGKPLPSGNDWEVMTEEDYLKLDQQKEEVSSEQQAQASPFTVLKDLFDDESDEE